MDAKKRTREAFDNGGAGTETNRWFTSSCENGFFVVYFTHESRRGWNLFPLLMVI